MKHATKVSTHWDEETQTAYVVATGRHARGLIALIETVTAVPKPAWWLKREAEGGT